MFAEFASDFEGDLLLGHVHSQEEWNKACTHISHSMTTPRQGLCETCQCHSFAIGRSLLPCRGWVDEQVKIAAEKKKKQDMIQAREQTVWYCSRRQCSLHCYQQPAWRRKRNERRNMKRTLSSSNWAVRPHWVVVLVVVVVVVVVVAPPLKKWRY